MAETISINCLLHGEGPNEGFTVKIQANKNISILKQRIKDKRQLFAAAKDIRLIKVSLAPDEVSRMANPLAIPGAQELSQPLDLLVDHFQNVNIRHVHVIALRPAETISINCLLDGDDPNKGFTVEIQANENISILKQCIKYERQLFVDASDIRLIKVSLAPDEVSRVADPLAIPGAQELSRPLDLLADHFQNVNIRHIHVIALRPVETISINCLLDGDDPDKVFTVEIQANENISILKQCIKDKRQLFAAAKDIRLIKVSLALDEVSRVADPLAIPGAQELSQPLDLLVDHFQNVNIRHVHVIALRPVAPPAAAKLKRPRSIDDALPEVAARKKYLKQAHKTKSPSAAARSPEAIRRAQAKCPLYNGRPIDLTGPPISIYEPIFATIDDKLRDLKSVNGDPLIEAVTKLVVDVNKVYDDESSYQAGTVKSLGAALGISLTEFVSTASGTERTTESDGLWKCKLADDLSEAIVVHVEWKLELGIGGEGQLQNALCLRKQLTERQYKGVVNSSCCPSILITMAGPYISFAGFLFAEVWISQAFTPCLPLILKPGMEQEQIQELSKYFTVFKEAIGNLKDKYSRVMVQNDMTLSMLLPRPEYLPNKAPPEDLQFIERFQFEGLHSDDHMCYLFKAQYGDKPALVKFGGRYGEDAHRLLANEGLAPELYFCTTIAGGLTMAVMENLSEAQQVGTVFWRAQIPQRVFDDVKRAVQILHANKLVFGDLRQPNILVTQLADGVWRTQLVDFTWAGTEGVARYPHYELNPEIKWHPEVQVGCLIKREHDLHMLELLQKS